MNFLTKFKKGIASVALMGLAFMVMPVSAASLGFTDDAEIPSWANEAISELMAIGVLNGNDDGSFSPNRELNRAEVSKIITLAADVAMDTTGGPHFPDVEEGAWYYDYIETMYNYGWVNGYPDGTFRPADGVNRAEIAKMVVNAFEITEEDNGPSFSDVNPSDWFYSYVETVKSHGIMMGYGDGTFGPGAPVTRAETAKIVYEGLLVATEPTGPAAGTLEVSLSDDTPRGTNIPYNATSVPFTTLNLTASDDSDVEVSSITVTRLGLGDNDDFENVWLEIDGFKVGNDKSINNDDIVELRFNPPIVVPAGQTLVADIVASSKFTATDKNIGHHNRLSVVSASDVVSTAANVVGDFPIEGEEMEVADYEVSQLVFSDLGTNTTVNVGDSFSELGKFRLQNSSTTNKDIELRAITFKNTGTAELANDLENVALYVSGEQVSAETIVDGDYLTFRLDNGVTGGYVIEDGDSRIFSIRADVVSAELNDTIQFKVDNFEDIVGVEIGTAFGVKSVDGAGHNAEDQYATLKLYTIDSGDVNVSRDPNSLGNQEYAPGSNDVVAMTARVVVSQPILVDGVTLKVDSYSTTNNTLADLNNYFDNFRLYLNDNLVDSENTLTGTDANPTLVYSTQFEITGASVLKLVVNIKDAAVTNSWVKFGLYATDFDSPEYISSGDTVANTDLLGSALASKVEVIKSVMTITRTDGFSAETVVAGVTDVSFMKFVMDNNDSGDVDVTSITIKGIGTGVAATNYSNFTASIFVDGQQIGSSKTLDSSTGTAAFNDIAVVVPSAGQEEFTVILDTIEAAATEALANTTVVNGSGTTAIVASPANVAGLSTPVADTGTATITLGTDPVTAADSSITIDGSTYSTVVGDTLATIELGVIALSPTAGGTTITDNGTPGDGIVLLSDPSGVTVAGIATAGTDTLAINVVSNGDGVVTHNSADAIATTHTITVEAPGVLIGLTAGDEIVISTDGNITTAGAEVLTVSSAVLAGATSITVDEAFAQTHTDEMVSTVARQYPIGATSFDVASTNNISVGDTLSGTTPSCVVTAVSGSTVTCTAALTAALPLGTAITEASGGSTLKLAVVSADVDNAENGSTVDVLEGGDSVKLGDGNTDGVGEDGDCASPVSHANNYLCGATFTFTKSGTLSVSETGAYASDILVADSTGVEIWKMRLNANDDEVQVKDLYLMNNIGGSNNFDSRADFMLYNEAGQLLATEQMIGGKLHFELNSNKIIVPKDGNTTVTVKVDLRSITDVNQTAKQVQLKLDTTAPYTSGMQAVTGATGSDLAQTAISGAATGVNFVAYKTKMTLDRMPTSSTTLLGSTKLEIFRFKVTPDTAGDIYLDTVSLNIVDGSSHIASLSTEDASDSSKVYTTSAAGVIDFSELLIDSAKEFVVYADTTAGGAPSSGESISVNIKEDSSYHAPGTSTAILAVPSNIVWSDDSNSAGSNDYLNGYLLHPDTTATTISMN